MSVLNESRVSVLINAKNTNETFVSGIQNLFQKSKLDIEVHCLQAGSLNTKPLEEWIQMQKAQGDIPYLLTIGGRDYTLNELLNEIRLNTEFGQKFVKDLNMLTIDLLLRRKEKL